jgi:inner membrane protein involved in colicin E2 resistance
MGKRIAAILFIFFCTAIAWAILGATIVNRTNTSRSELTGKVASTWGSPHEQSAPKATYVVKTTHPKVTIADGRRIEQTEEETAVYALPLESSKVNVALDLEYRQKGLLWYSTYRVRFDGLYGFRNNSGQERMVTLQWPYPADKAVYDDLLFFANGQPLAMENQKGSASSVLRVPTGEAVLLKVQYGSQGLSQWRYSFGADIAQARDFTLRMTTNFRDIDFPENTLSPSRKEPTADGWALIWNYKNLVSGYQIAVQMPEKLQPGPLAGEISFFAPVSLFFFFFLMFIIATMRGIDLHPMNYFFLAAAFLAFHLLLAYLVDHVAIHFAFVICSAVSIALVVTYLRLVVGPRFAVREAGIAQFVYLVLFSYAFFFKGFTGLAVTIGVILTLFVVMQMTGRIRWTERFTRSPA